jgi:hypothetical protein
VLLLLLLLVVVVEIVPASALEAGWEHTEVLHILNELHG